jgi:Ceramidase
LHRVTKCFAAAAISYQGLCYRADMTPDRPKRHLPVLAFSGLTALSLAGLLLLPPIPQDQTYHQFADQRTILGVPNFWNVVSNLPFLAVGAAGLRRFRDNTATIVFFLGVFLTGIGSSYYHWDPNDDTLSWDRLPMTLSFAAILALVVEERVSARTVAILLWPALATGLFSLLVWRWTDDLRLYFWVQFFPGLAMLSLFVLYPPRYTGTYYWIAVGVLYALAKLFEFTDEAIYRVGYFLSGHTLKHLAAAASCFAILRYFQARQPILQGAIASCRPDGADATMTSAQRTSRPVDRF